LNFFFTFFFKIFNTIFKYLINITIWMKLKRMKNQMSIFLKGILLTNASIRSSLTRCFASNSFWSYCSYTCLRISSAARSCSIKCSINISSLLYIHIIHKRFFSIKSISLTNLPRFLLIKSLLTSLYSPIFRSVSSTSILFVRLKTKEIFIYLSYAMMQDY
jgi:hypothetical protein